MREALKVKADFTAASHRALEVVASIESDDKWSWARNNQMPVLKMHVGDLKSALSPWASQFMLESDMQKLKKAALPRDWRLNLMASYR